MKFEAGKEYKTRNGTRARIYSTDTMDSSDEAIHGAIFVGGYWNCRAWYKSGNHLVHSAHIYDLMPPAREFWVNVYGNVMDNVIHESRLDAIACATDGCLETIKVREVLEDE